MAAAQRNQRRAPSQARAQATCAAILEATTRILEELGEPALTTNRIAERAGVSIGTLYQYYPNKQAILVAIGRRENARMDGIAAELMAAGVSERRARIRAYVRALSDRPATRRAVLKAMLESESADVLWPSGPEAVDAFVMSRAVIGAVRAAVLEGSPYLTQPVFEDALVKLVGALQAQP
ncbi:TetR/AcrR family transcriptional regulator [Phenylobacterium terrae]|uniref:TetR/AcrR family transcriptional regulator n=1 Tax=Phenylobacterium terrae TaxID=2665495 RepID=A0ABW4N434_9CAUL